MDGRATMGHARVEDHAEGGSGCVCGRYGVWCTANDTGSIRRTEQQPGCDRSPTTHEGHSGMTNSGARHDAWHGTRATANTRGLREAEYVFVRRDASHGQPQTPYTGPYCVLQRQDKYFVIQCGNREESVSVDRLKPVNAEPDRPIVPAIPLRRGCPRKQRDERPAAERGLADTRPEPEPEQRPPTYTQVTRRGRAVRPPERYIATTSKHLPATMD